MFNYNVKIHSSIRTNSFLQLYEDIQHRNIKLIRPKTIQLSKNIVNNNKKISSFTM